jgi:hypothetical protein
VQRAQLSCHANNGMVMVLTVPAVPLIRAGPCRIPPQGLRHLELGLTRPVYAAAQASAARRARQRCWGGRNTECFGPRSLLRAGPRRSCTRWIARGRPSRWPCSASPTPSPPPPPPRRPATYPPARPPPARRAWGGRGGGGGGGRRGTTCSSAAGSSLKNKLAFFRSFDRVRNCHCRAVREAVREW